MTENIAPKALKKDHAITTHGHTRIDPYYWLRNREDQEVINYLEAENQYTQAVMAPVKQLETTLFEEMVGRIKQEDQSVPYKKNGYFYLTRFEEGHEYPIYARKKGDLQAPEEIMLNANELAQPYEYFHIGGLSVSPDNRLLAYGEDTVSRRIYTIRVKDLVTGTLLEEAIPNTTGSVAWANDNLHFFYTAKDPQTLRGYKIFRHRLGTPAEADVEVFHETDETYNAYVYKSKSDKYLIIGSHQTVSQEYRILEADHPEGVFRVFQPRERQLEHHIAHYENRFYILTNLEATNFRLMVTPEDHTEKTNWQEVIPHREDVLLEDLDIFKDFLVLSERREGISQIRVIPRDGEEHYIEFREEAHMAYTSQNPEFDTPILRLGYQSMTTPPTVYDYDMRTRSFTLLKQQEVLGGFSPDHYRSERLFVQARDGARVPVSLVYPKDFRPDGSSPLLLYGYGSYGASMEPYFSAARLSLLDRGFAFAIAHIRGGEEMGRPWYDNGKLLKKMNTFHDFIDVGKYLVAAGYAAPDGLFAMGGSAGGLLMGAVMNLDPGMWKGIVAAVPFVDVVTTMLDESIPLTTFEYDEWGNPNDKTYYDYMLSYSPYDNVKAGDYPALLVTTGLHDSQVQYWEPAKWVARLRELKADSNPLLLHTNMEAGHGGASGRFQRLKEVAREYAFLLGVAEGKL